MSKLPLYRVQVVGEYEPFSKAFHATIGMFVGIAINLLIHGV